MPLPKMLPDLLPNLWADMVFGMLGRPAESRSTTTAAKTAGTPAVSSRAKTSAKSASAVGKAPPPQRQDYWQPQHEAEQCVDARDCNAQLKARQEARDRRNGKAPEWQGQVMQHVFNDDGTIRRQETVEKPRRQTKVLRDRDQWCEDMGVDVTNSLWALPPLLQQAGRGDTHKTYDDRLALEQERMRAFDDNKLGGQSAARVITEMPLSLAPKFATGSRPYRKLKDIFGNFLQDSATEAEQLDAVRRLADYHAICEHRRWGE